jgi:hypothetical protein
MRRVQFFFLFYWDLLELAFRFGVFDICFFYLVCDVESAAREHSNFVRPALFPVSHAGVTRDGHLPSAVNARRFGSPRRPDSVRRT